MCHRLGFDHKNLHHSAESVWHRVCAYNETLEHLVYDMLTQVSQVLASAVKRSRVGCMTTLKDRSMIHEELALIERHLMYCLRRVMMLVDHEILEHAVLVENLLIDLLV